MKDIKYRVWDKKNKEWFEGGFSIGRNGDFLITLSRLDVTEEDLEVNLYTCLKDKNENLIYEGDIIRFNTKGGNEMIYDVRWRGKGFKPTRMSLDNQEEMEIIGNIYENPDLLSPSNIEKK